MPDLVNRLEVLRGRSPVEIARLIGRKYLYREVRMDRIGIRAGDTVTPQRQCGWSIEMWGPERYDQALAGNEYLTEDDLDHFHRQRSTCIVVLDGDRIAANSWMTNGEVYVHELHRTHVVPESEHFSCRSYVNPDYRGQSLLGHMIAAYSATVPADDRVWGLVYPWNTASLLSLERLGWMTDGQLWTRFVFGRKFPGASDHPLRRPSVGGGAP